MAETEIVAAPTPSGTAVELPKGGRPPRAWRNPRLILGVSILAVLYLGGLAARLWVGRDEMEIFAFPVSLSPGADHMLGTDKQGRDVLAAMVYSTAPTFEMVLLAGFLATLVGTAAGLVSGYFRGAPDTIVRGISDVMLGIPAFSMLILVAAIIGNLTLIGMGLVIALFSWPLVARAVRAQVLSLREQPFVTISRLSNRGSISIMVFELLPNMLTFVTAMFVGAVSGALAMAIGVQLIGLGPVDTQTLGLTLQNALSNGALSQGVWWWWLPPAGILVLFFVGLFLVSLAVDEISNPRLRKAAGHG
jgi:peptide/nickel transport system permease protein